VFHSMNEVLDHGIGRAEPSDPKLRAAGGPDHQDDPVPIL
jgi:hypothetical protein